MKMGNGKKEENMPPEKSLHVHVNIWSTNLGMAKADISRVKTAKTKTNKQIKR
jgi:hypothetical protein